MNKPERVFAEDVEYVESADVLVDISTRDEVILGLRLNAEDENVIVPMSLSFAEDIAKNLLVYTAIYKAIGKDRLGQLRGA
jgi:hypothetical protein